MHAFEKDFDNTILEEKIAKQLKNLKRKSCMQKLIKCFLDQNDTQRACTSCYGQAPQKITDPLEDFSIHQS